MTTDLESCYNKLCVVLKDMEDKIYWNAREYSEYVCVDEFSEEERKTLLDRIHQKNPQESSKIKLKNNFLMIDEDTLRSFKGYAIIFEF